MAENINSNENDIVFGNMMKKDYEVLKMGDWEDISEKQIQDIVSCFIPKDNDIELDMTKFDFRVYTKEYYMEKFPHFPPEVYFAREECSKNKIGTIKEEEPPNTTKVEGDTILNFE